MIAISIVTIILLLGLYFATKDKSEVENHVDHEKPGYDLITKHLPEIFSKDQEYSNATMPQLKFLTEIGYNHSKQWTKESASFALSSFKIVKYIFEDDFGVEATDAVAIDVISRAFKSKTMAKQLYKLHENEDDYEDLPAYEIFYEWMEKNIAPMYDI